MFGNSFCGLHYDSAKHTEWKWKNRVYIYKISLSVKVRAENLLTYRRSGDGQYREFDNFQVTLSGKNRQ